VRFADALAAPGFGAIAEFKRRSPSAGDLRPDGDVVAVARAYEANGARAMSVLVDERFGGTWDDLRAARAATSLPLIAKGFFRTADDLRTAAEAGADAALLLLRDLDETHGRRRAPVAELETQLHLPRHLRPSLAAATHSTVRSDEPAAPAPCYRRPPCGSPS